MHAPLFLLSPQMDSIDFNNVKAEKAKALHRYHRFLIIPRFFRAAEVCVSLLFVFWTFTRLPFAFQISRDFLRRISGFISTPLLVFLLGNCIVVLLLTKSSHDPANAETEIYQALVRSVENRSKASDEEDLADEIVYDDKLVIATTNSYSYIPHDENDRVEIDSDSVADEPKVYSKSDVSGKQSPDRMVIKPPTLQRSETDKCRMRMEGKVKEEDKNYPEDNLSNEEFQKTIEAFIAKQLMFRRQESLAVVVHNKP